MDWVAKQSVKLMPGASWLLLFAKLAVIDNYIRYALASSSTSLSHFGCGAPYFLVFLTNPLSHFGYATVR